MPRILVMSDSHENVGAIKRTVDFFNSVIEGDKNSIVIHCGDIISPIMVAHLKTIKTKIVGVFGNNDGEKNLWRKRFQEFPDGIEINERFYEMNFSDKKILVLHEPYLLEALADSGKYDFIFYGHTHIIDLKKISNGTVVVNPGEVSGYLTGKSTCGVVDLEGRTVSIHDVNNPAKVIEKISF